MDDLSRFTKDEAKNRRYSCRVVKASTVSLYLCRQKLCHTYSLNHHSIYGVRKFAAMCTGAKTQT